MRRNIRCDIRASDRLDRKPHGKQGICIMSEHLSVGEISPASHDLSDQKTQHRNIRDLEEILLPDLTENEKRQETADHCTVNRDTALSDIQKLIQMILIVIPTEYHIIDPGTQNRENNCRNRKVPQNIFRKSLLIRHMVCQCKPKQHTKCNDHTVKRDCKAKDRKAFREVFQINTQMRKRNVPFIHHSLHLLPYTLKRNRITSPSCTTYSFPSMPTSPFSLAAAREPYSIRSL